MFAKALLAIQQTFTNPYYAPNYTDTKMDKPSHFPRGIHNLVNFNILHTNRTVLFGTEYNFPTHISQKTSMLGL